VLLGIVSQFNILVFWLALCTMFVSCNESILVELPHILDLEHYLESS
jgi:hypothetical protein